MAIAGATGLVAAGGVFAARTVITRQAAIARRRIGKPHGQQAPDADRLWRAGLTGDPVDLLVLGDSIAAGLGAVRRKDTPGARIAKGLAAHAGRPVRLCTAAIVGSESSKIGGQLDRLPSGYRPDVAVIVVGGNDITHRVPVTVSVSHLVEAIDRLHALGATVVVGTCPDLGALRPVPQPLRALGSRLSRQLAEAQADAAEHAGARSVSLRRAVGAVFISQPDEMFSLDRFHPSALGYRRTAEAIVPVVTQAFDEMVASGMLGGPTRSPSERTDHDTRGPAPEPRGRHRSRG